MRTLRELTDRVLNDQCAGRLRREAEALAVNKASWQLDEYRALSDRYADAVEALQIAVANEDFAGIRSAWLTLEEIAFQSTFMNTSLFRIIEKAQAGVGS